MSTPSNDPKPVPEAPSAGGVNAWKVSRPGLAAPKPAVKRETPPSSVVGETTPSATPTRFKPADGALPNRRRVALYLAAGIVAACALTGVWFAGGGKPRPPVTAARSEVARDVSLVSPGTNRTSAMPSYRALVIGINQYASAGGDGWQSLASARSDAEAIARTLETTYGFRVQTLLDGKATRAAILNALDDLATSEEDDADLIYFAGHGSYDEKLQEGYWIPADARRTVDGRQAKEDWLWNSTITRLIGASKARHVLVLSDACYGGSLFRGDEPLNSRGGQAWYERAITRPSRYLITSGGIEPVLDSGAGHSVFAQQVINYLEYGERDVFSANDLGSALRERVAQLTGQMVQMGPLPVSGHAGGEFVFVRQKAGAQFVAELAAAPTRPSEETVTRGEAASVPPAQARQEAIRDAVALTRAGAPKAANQLVSAVLQQNAQDSLARAVAEYVKRSQGQEARDELRALIESVEKKAATATGGTARAASARPRVLAVIGPSLPADASGSDTAGLLYRLTLRAELENCSSLRVIEREALETVLQEQRLGVSDLADPRARTAIGKLLPASLLLLGDVVPSAGGDKLFLRLVDTETTQVVASFTATRKASDDQEKVCLELAEKIAGKVAQIKPLLAPVASCAGKHLQAGVGVFHGVRTGTEFVVVSRILRDKNVPDDYVEKTLGTATVQEVSEFSSELQAVWTSGQAPASSEGLWVRERTAVAAR